jgi:hypothetical protein
MPAHPAKGASSVNSPAPAPLRSTVRRAGLDTSWMLGLAERLLSSIREKSLLMVLFSSCFHCQLFALTLVKVSQRLYWVISAMAEAAPAVGSRPGGFSVIASTRVFFGGWA